MLRFLIILGVKNHPAVFHSRNNQFLTFLSLKFHDYPHFTIDLHRHSHYNNHNEFFCTRPLPDRAN